MWKGPRGQWCLYAVSPCGKSIIKLGVYCRSHGTTLLKDLTMDMATGGDATWRQEWLECPSRHQEHCACGFQKTSNSTGKYICGASDSYVKSHICLGGKTRKGVKKSCQGCK